MPGWYEAWKAWQGDNVSDTSDNDGQSLRVTGQVADGQSLQLYDTQDRFPGLCPCAEVRVTEVCGAWSNAVCVACGLAVVVFHAKGSAKPPPAE
jgi:hypothetical protein